MQGCWVMDCNRCVFLSHPSTRCQSLSAKQTHRRPNLPFRAGFYSKWVWEWLGMGTAAFPFPHMNGCPTGTEAVRPAAQYQTGTSWNGVSFRLWPGPLLWLKSRRTRDTWKKQQLIRHETHTHTKTQASPCRAKVNMSVHAVFPSTGKEGCHQQKHTSHTTAFDQNWYFSCQIFKKWCVCMCVWAAVHLNLIFLTPAAADNTKMFHCLHCLPPNKFPNSHMATKQEFHGLERKINAICVCICTVGTGTSIIM